MIIVISGNDHGPAEVQLAVMERDGHTAARLYLSPKDARRASVALDVAATRVEDAHPRRGPWKPLRDRVELVLP
jgi:hypothetical protein